MVHYVSFLRLILRLSREGINTFISLEVLSLVSACSLKVSSCSASCVVWSLLNPSVFNTYYYSS
jgi:hypothetical protein